jgi:hypothetical protein
MQKRISGGLVIGVLLLSVLAGCAAPEATQAPGIEPSATPAEVVSTETALPSATTLPQATATAVELPVNDFGQIQFSSGGTSWYTNGDVQPGTVSRYWLSAPAGQQVSAWLSVDGASADAPLAELAVSTAGGSVYDNFSSGYFSKVLPEAQQLYLDIRSLSDQPVTYTLSVEIPAAHIDPANGDLYEPVDASVCQLLRDVAAQALGVEFSMQSPAPFQNFYSAEVGQGCRLTAHGDGTQFSGPQAVVTALKNSAGLGWTEQPLYQADGPTGTSIGMTRDMGLMLISAKWEPAAGTICPSDQPIGACGLSGAQQFYTIRIAVAQFKATFSLDGHWVDEADNFTLDLTQEFKMIGGSHSVVAENGSKIDSLDDSISGMLKGNTVHVQFQSSFAAGPGQAEITYVDANTITWKITQAPEGEYYLPAEATLTRQ